MDFRNAGSIQIRQYFGILPSSEIRHTAASMSGSSSNDSDFNITNADMCQDMIHGRI